jgi:prefoldin subunit 5
MKRGLLSLLLLSLVLSLPTWAASGLEALRAEAQGARAQVRELRERQQALRSELNGLAGRIESLKAERQGRLVAGAELETALRRSQDLSGELTGLAQALAGAEGEAERRNLALHAALSEELVRVRAAWEATSDRKARAGMTDRMRTLRAERDAVRSALPPSRVPALDKAEASDDPEDLLEQADALRDSEDKVRQRLKVLRTRITEVREEQELERRMGDFLGEESIFDEQDRRLRLRFDATTQSIQVDPSSPRAPTFGGRDMEAGAGPVSGGAPAENTDSTPLPPSAPSPSPLPTETPPDRSPTPAPAPTPARATDSRPQVGTVRAQTLASGELENLPDLEAEAARLEALARELDARAKALEHRVRELQ